MERARPTHVLIAVLVVGALLLASCGGEGTAAGPAATTVPSAAEEHALTGALQGLVVDPARVDAAARDRLLAEAAAIVDAEPRPREPLEVDDTRDPFVEDAQRAWTLALAGRISDDDRHRRAALRIVEAWIEVSEVVGTCPDSGGCHTSLMLSRAGPALVFAVDVLRADGGIGADLVERFHRWLRGVLVPAASDRDNNWGDAGTFLWAVAAAELGDRDLREQAARRWRERVDLIAPDGRIPEEVRRGDAALMYSQEALDYKVATADVLARDGLDVWEHEGRAGGSIRDAVDLVARSLADPAEWPGQADDLRVPDPAGLWPILARRTDDPTVAALAERAAEGDAEGHSALLWTSITHPRGVG